MVKDTVYNLEMRLQRIDEKVTSFDAYHSHDLRDMGVDLHNEKAVTLQCLRICERASSYIKSLQDVQPTLQRETTQQSTGDMLEQFEAQILTQKTLSENRNNLVAVINRLRTRLDSITHESGPDREKEILLLQEEINYSRQCLDVCKEASDQVSSQKIHIIGEVIAEEDCDQVVVTALADLFNVGLVKAKKKSMQLVGSMPADTLQQMSKDRYGSRFGAMESYGSDNVLTTSLTSEIGSEEQPVKRSHRTKEGRNMAPTAHGKPSSNEVRKRRTDEDNGMQ